MNRRWLSLIFGVLGLLMVYEIFNNRFSFFLIIIGIMSLFLKDHVSEQQENKMLLIGVGAFLLAIFSSRIALALVGVVLLILIGQNPELFQLIREVLTGSKDLKDANEFIMVDFTKKHDIPPKLSRNRWIGDDTETKENVYSWEDINFTKSFGNSIFDLGNTILPKEQNIILIRKGIGNTKIIVPEGVAISLDISLLLGKIKIGQEETTLTNETFKWHSANYHTSARKIKLVANTLVGEVEVVFL